MSTGVCSRCNNAAVNACGLLRNPKIKARLSYKRAIIEAKTLECTVITKQRQLKEYERIKGKAEESGKFSDAKGCLDSQSRIIGAFEADNLQQNLTLTDIMAMVGGEDKALIGCSSGCSDSEEPAIIEQKQG